MLRFADAERLAAELLERRLASAVAIQPQHTLDLPYGWVFFYQSTTYIETGQIEDMLFGNAPIVVNRFSGEVLRTGIALPLEHYLTEYERSLPSEQIRAVPEYHDSAPKKDIPS